MIRKILLSSPLSSPRKSSLAQCQTFSWTDVLGFFPGLSNKQDIRYLECVTTKRRGKDQSHDLSLWIPSVISCSLADKITQMSVSGNCAHFHKGGWWYNACGQANLNGVWYTGGVYRSKFQDGIFWAEYGGGFYSMKSVRMLIRPIDWGRQQWAKLENKRDSI